jgi:TonB-dependent receptor
MAARQTSLRIRHSVACAVALALSPTLHAQDADDGLEEIVVTGSRAMLINAIEAQRNANGVVSVIDSDAAGDFADINVSESLRRLPGIMVENDQGEGRYVSVRGMSTDLNAMTINGVSTASPEDRRGIMLDGVPSDMLESMTVYKTLTPNLDADTIGGAIDLETISAFKYEGLYTKLKAETSYNELTKDSGNPKLALTATNRWAMGDGEFGAAMTISYQNRRIIAHNNETGGWSADSVALDEDYEMRFYDLERERSGIVLNLDYRGPNEERYYAKLFHNEYTDTEWRAKWEVRRSFEGDSSVSGNIFTYPNQRIDTESRARAETRTISSVQLGTEFMLSDQLAVKAEIFGSTAEQDDTDAAAVIFRSGTIRTPFTYDNSNPRKPVLNYVDALYDASNYEMNAFEDEDALTEDQDLGFRLDLTYALNEATQVQYGVKYRARQKDNNFNFCAYEPDDEILLSSIGNVTVGPYLANVHGPAPTYDATFALLNTRSSSRIALSDGTFCIAPGTGYSFSGDEDAESIPGDWYTDEDIFAGYVMGTTVLDQVTVVYGLRYEQTKSTFAGKNFDGDAFAGNVEFKNDYGFLAPSLNVKYDLSETQVMRFGLFRSLVRPGFGESSAGAEVNTEDNEVSGGNPDLKPTKAWNLDLSYEWYPSRETFFSTGLFYKRLEDPILEVSATDIEFRGQLWSRADTFINAEDSSIFGAEFAFQTAFESGLFIVFNYTYADGDSDLPESSPYGARTIPYFKQAKNTFNASVGYDKGPWDVRLSANYRDNYLDEIGEGALADRYTNEFMQIDLKGKYQLNDNLEFMASVINLNDRPEFYYFGNKNRLSQYDEYGTTYEIGFNYKF